MFPNEAKEQKDGKSQTIDLDPHETVFFDSMAQKKLGPDAKQQVAAPLKLTGQEKNMELYRAAVKAKEHNA